MLIQFPVLPKCFELCVYSIDIYVVMVNNTKITKRYYTGYFSIKWPLSLTYQMLAVQGRGSGQHILLS